MIVKYLPWLISALTIYCMVLTGNKHRYSWALSLVNQALWLTWIIASQTWGMLPMNVVLWVIFTRNHLKWNADKAATAEDAEIVKYLLSIASRINEDTAISLWKIEWYGLAASGRCEWTLREAIALDIKDRNQAEAEIASAQADWCKSMNQPKSKCRCPDCGPCLVDYAGE